MKIKKLLNNNGFLMISSSMMSQILLIVTIPILSRMFSPQDFGLFTLFSNIAFLFIPIINGRYDLLVLNALDDREVIRFSKISWYITLVMIFIIIPLASFYFFLTNKSLIYSFFLLMILLLVSVNNITTSIASQRDDYKLVSLINLTRTIILIILQLLFGYLSMGSYGLIIGMVFSYSAGLLYSLKFWKEFSKKKDGVTKQELKQGFHENIDQLRYSSTSILLNTLSMSLVVFAIDIIFSKKEVGYYGMSLRVLNIPITIISLSLSKIFMQQANKAYLALGSFKRILTRYSIVLFMVSLIMFFPLYIIPQTLISKLLGNSWGGMMELIRILLPMYILKLVVTTLSLSFVILKKQKLEMILQGMFIIIALLVISLTMIIELNFMEFLYLYSIGFILCYILYFINIYKNS